MRCSPTRGVSDRTGDAGVEFFRAFADRDGNRLEFMINLDLMPIPIADFEVLEPNTHPSLTADIG